MARRRSLALLTASLFVVGGVGVSLAIVGPEPTADEIFADHENERTKAEIIAEDEALKKIGEEDPAPVPAHPENAGPAPDPSDRIWEVGIFPDAEFPTGDVTFENRWQGHVRGWNATVFAGSYRGDATTGIVLVQLTDPVTLGSKFEGPFEAPIAGPLSLVSFEGSVLTLKGKEGATVDFDVETEHFS